VGVGGTLQIMPVSITVASLAAAAVPGLVSAVVLRFSEAVNRYTFNRTGMELLFLPLPSGLKNRTKAFVDIFVDRFGRGIAGILLALMLWAGLRDMRIVAILTLVFTGTWILLARIAQREYTDTVRSRIERRRLELEDARLTVGDPGTLRLLEQTVECANARQACYALSMLAEAPGYDLAPLLCRLSTSPLLEVRAKVYAVAGSIGAMELLAAALAEIQAPESQNVKPAVAYVLAVSPEAAQRAAPAHRDLRTLRDDAGLAVQEPAQEIRPVGQHLGGPSRRPRSPNIGEYFGSIADLCHPGLRLVWTEVLRALNRVAMVGTL
jgi:hypothetical protein